MQTILIAGLSMLVLSLATAGVAAAATLPEFKPVPTKKKFTDTSGTVTFRWGTNLIECTKSSTAGEITGGRTVGKANMVLTGCKTSDNEATYCAIESSYPAGPEEIVMKSLKGELGTVKTTQAPSGVGLLLEPETGKILTELAANSCTVETKMTGSLGAEVQTVGKKQTTNKLVFSNEKPSKITSIKLDSGEIAEPELVAWSKSITTAATDELKFEEAVEVT